MRDGGVEGTSWETKEDDGDTDNDVSNGMRGGGSFVAVGVVVTAEGLLWDWLRRLAI